MADTPEVKVKKKIKAMLKEQGVYYAMPIGSTFGNSGVPDFLCCVNGTFLAIEAKAGDNQATALQMKHLREIREAGGYGLVINEENLPVLAERIKTLKGR
jgi:pantoate kinase